jgi:hypothetical protein
MLLYDYIIIAVFVTFFMATFGVISLCHSSNELSFFIDLFDSPYLVRSPFFFGWIAMDFISKRKTVGVIIFLPMKLKWEENR